MKLSSVSNVNPLQRTIWVNSLSWNICEARSTVRNLLQTSFHRLTALNDELCVSLRAHVIHSCGKDKSKLPNSQVPLFDRGPMADFLLGPHLKKDLSLSQTKWLPGSQRKKPTRRELKTFSGGWMRPILQQHVPLSSSKTERSVCHGCGSDF